jgi:hypothetical protein
MADRVHITGGRSRNHWKLYGCLPTLQTLVHMMKKNLIGRLRKPRKRRPNTDSIPRRMVVGILRTLPQDFRQSSAPTLFDWAKRQNID